MKPVLDYVNRIDTTTDLQQVNDILLTLQAECFDHVAGIIMDQAPMAVDPVGYRSLAAYFIAEAHKVCPFHVTDPRLLEPTVSSPSKEVEKRDPPSDIAIPGQSTEERPMESTRDYDPSLEPPEQT